MASHSKFFRSFIALSTLALCNLQAAVAIRSTRPTHNSTAQTAIIEIAAEKFATAPVVTAPIATAPVATNPVATNPVATNPVATNLVATNPVATNPVATNPVATNPVATNPVATNPVATNPVATNPVATARTKPAQSTTPERNATAAKSRNRTARNQPTRDADFVFVGPADKHWNEFRAEYGFKPKLWNPREAAVFAADLRRIRKSHPAFFAHSISACKPLGLIRRSMTDDDNGDLRGRGVCMMTGVATIEVDDTFFQTNADYQTHATTHEMAHLLDTANYLSTSPEFMRIAAPKIASVKKSYGNKPYAPFDTETTDLGDRIAKRVGLPSLDAAENLPECFAESVAFYLSDGPKSVSADLRAFIQTHVLKQDSVAEKARRLYVEAETATDDGRYDDAFKALNELIVSYPQMLDVHACRARIWGFKKDFEMMEYEAKQELALLQRRHIPHYHWTWDRATELLQDARTRHGFDQLPATTKNGRRFAGFGI